MNSEKFRPAAVIFDMDGLMFDTERLTIPMWTTAGKPFGYNITEDVVHRLIGISGEKSQEILQEVYGKDFPYDEIRESFRNIVLAEFEKNGVPKKPGLDFLQERLLAEKIPLAVATSTRRSTAHLMLKRAGIYDRFQAIICGDDVTNGKPAPDIYLLAAEKLGHSPSSCVGFEDSTAGLRALAAAGIKSIFVKDLVQPPQDVLDTVWLSCGDLSEAVQLFDI